MAGRSVLLLVDRFSAHMKALRELANSVKLWNIKVKVLLINITFIY